MPNLTPQNLRIALFIVTGWAVLAAWSFFGFAPALIALAAGALLLGITLLWSSVQSLTGETPLSLEEALTLGAPSFEEEQKRSLLRALKDLDYERSVGKITPEDYQELSARYRAEAKRLMHGIDQSLGPAREHAEKLFRQRLAREAEAQREAESEAPPSEAPPSEAPPSEAPPSEPKSEKPASEAPASTKPAPEKLVAEAASPAPRGADPKPPSGLEAVAPTEPEVKS